MNRARDQRRANAHALVTDSYLFVDIRLRYGYSLIGFTFMRDDPICLLSAQMVRRRAHSARSGAAFDGTAVINGFKLRIERAIAFGPDHPVVQARYAARAAMLADLSLDQSIARVERWRRDERKAFQIASIFGRATRLSLEVISELRLFLRLMRRKRMHDEYEVIRTAVAASLRANGSGPKWPAR